MTPKYLKVSLKVTLSSSITSLNSDLTIAKPVNSSIMSVTDVYNEFWPGFNLLPQTKLYLQDIGLFSEIINNVQESYKREDNKFQIMITQYLFATSNFIMPVENRFISLMIILEMLYVSKSRERITHKLSTRLAQLFHGKDMHKIAETDFDTVEKKHKLIKNLYKMRSSIVHTGKTKGSIDKQLVLLMDISRISILLYLEDMNTFSEEELQNFC